MSENPDMGHPFSCRCARKADPSLRSRMTFKGIRQDWLVRTSSSLDAFLAGLPDVFVDLQAEAGGEAVG